MPSLQMLLKAVPDDAGIKDCCDKSEVGGASFHPAVCQTGCRGPLKLIQPYQEPGSQLRHSLSAPFPQPTSWCPQAWPLGSRSQEGKCHFLLIIPHLSFFWSQCYWPHWSYPGPTPNIRFNILRWSMSRKKTRSHFQVLNHLVTRRLVPVLKK